MKEEKERKNILRTINNIFFLFISLLLLAFFFFGIHFLIVGIINRNIDFIIIGFGVLVVTSLMTVFNLYMFRNTIKDDVDYHRLRSIFKKKVDKYIPKDAEILDKQLKVIKVLFLLFLFSIISNTLIAVLSKDYWRILITLLEIIGMIVLYLIYLKVRNAKEQVKNKLTKET